MVHPKKGFNLYHELKYQVISSEKREGIDVLTAVKKDFENYE